MDNKKKKLLINNNEDQKNSISVDKSNSSFSNSIIYSMPTSLIHRISPYLIALRPWSFTASICPVLLGTALCYISYNNFSGLIFLFTIICAVSVHGAGNLVNTYYDYIRGIDSQKKSDDRTLVDHILSPNDVSTMGGLCYGLGCLSFLFLCYFSPSPVPHLALLYFGGLSSSFLYTGGLGLKYLALGDFIIFITFGPLTVLFTFIAQGGYLSFFPLLHALPMALNTEAILHANNMRDMTSDREAGIITLAILIGKTSSYLLLVCLLFLPYVIFIYISINFSFFFFLPLFSIFFAFSIERETRSTFDRLPQHVSKLNILMSILYIIACLLAGSAQIPWLSI